MEDFPSEFDKHGLTSLPEQIIAHEHAPAMQNRNENERNRRCHDDPGFLIVKSNVGELAKKHRDEGRSGTRSDHEDERHRDLATMRLQISHQPKKTGIELGFETKYKRHARVEDFLRCQSLLKERAVRSFLR